MGINNQRNLFILETVKIINPIIIMSRKNRVPNTGEPTPAHRYH
ncbi:hypothetical protein DDI_2876 [Dickeya dianthicola RNS04.9]|nr:hypothetical protein DDI_2876 [Dickeya dianthicola RNS04.9]